MGCPIEQTERKVIHDPQSCIICRDQPCNAVPLATGFLYPKCSIVINGATKFDPKEPLTDLATQCDRIYGVVTCTVDYLDETAETCVGVKEGVLTTGEFDPYYICWPEGTTKELVDAYACQASCCLRFRWRTNCTVLPEEYQYRLDAISPERFNKLDVAIDKAPVAEVAAEPTV